jgi:hypothetical protein
MLEIFLQMNERTRGLDQAFEEIVVGGVGVEPKLFQHVVRFVIVPLVPATKIGAVEPMLRYIAGEIHIVTFEFAHELRNPLAFAHVRLNLGAAQMMGKLRRFIFQEGHEVVRGRNPK